MTILELREKRNTAWNAAKAFLDSHRTEKGTLTAEDDATYSRMEQEIADLGKEIARLERQEALEAELNKPVNKPLTSKPVTAAEKPAKTGRASDEYKTGMLQALRTNFRQFRYPTSCRKVSMPMAATLFRRNMTIVLSMF